MKTLVKKEIRLMLPAFAAAIVLAILPVWLLPVGLRNQGGLSGMAFFFGVLMLALSSFGREIGLRTLPFMLAQPLERSRIWRTKIVVLSGAIALACVAWSLSSLMRSSLSDAFVELPDALDFLGMGAMYVAVGLWLTLLLRQVVAAFLLTFLVPVVLIIPIQALGANDWVILVLMGFYAVAAFFLARWQFLHLQDAAWTGGVVTLGRKRAVAAGPIRRERRPWAALFLKELQLHEFTLAGIAGLFVLHLGAVALRKGGAHVFSRNTLSLLEMFGVVWACVPLLAGSQSVAEERQLGTLDALLCLPVSRRMQFCVKALFVLVLGGLVSPALVCVAEWIGNAIGAGANLGYIGLTFKGSDVLLVFYAFLALSLVGFYTSTLTRSVVQSLAAGVVGSVVFWVIYRTGSADWSDAFGTRLWPVMAVPALTAAIVWLAYGNFRWQFESGRRWRWSIFGLAIVLVLVSGSAAAVYHRAWEWAMPLEGPHGPARLPMGKQVLLRGYGFPWLAAILPDGRFWVDMTSETNTTMGSGYFVAGSNWVDSVALAGEMVGIQSNGTLWVSEKPRHDHMVQFGEETDWESVAREWSSTLVLLKRDGTLWRWGTTNSMDHKNYQGLRSFPPYRVGEDSDWARITRGSYYVFAWKRNGDACVLHLHESNQDWGDMRLPLLDHTQFQSFSSWTPEVGLRDDGTLWVHQDWWGPFWGTPVDSRARGKLPAANLMQLGADSKWAAVAGGSQVVALKTDGSIWKWNLFRNRRMIGPRESSPERLGMHNDWVSVGNWRGYSVALAADGSLWSWPATELPRGWDNNTEKWLAPSRRAAKIGNIFDGKQ